MQIVFAIALFLIRLATKRRRPPVLSKKNSKDRSRDKDKGASGPVEMSKLTGVLLQDNSGMAYSNTSGLNSNGQVRNISSIAA
jgi:hypothetical protein